MLEASMLRMPFNAIHKSSRLIHVKYVWAADYSLLGVHGSKSWYGLFMQFNFFDVNVDISC